MHTIELVIREIYLLDELWVDAVCAFAFGSLLTLLLWAQESSFMSDNRE